MNDDLTPSAVADFIKNDTVNREDTLRQNILTAADTNPDQHAEAVKLGRTANVPADFVAADIESYRKEGKIDSALVKSIVTNYPAFDSWLDNQDNAKIVHDDVPALTGVLDTVRAFPSGAITSLGQGVEGLGSLSASASQVLKGMSEKNRYMAMDSNFQMLRLYTGLFGIAAQPTGQVVQEVGEFVGPPEERQTTATNISSGVGQVAGQVLTYWLTGGAGNAALTIGQGAQQQTDRLDAEGITDPEKRLLAQGLGGAATFATERVELGVLLKGVPGLDKLMGQLPKALQNKWANRVIDVTAAGGAEAAQETLEGFLQDTIEYGIYNEDVEFLKGMQQQAGEAGAVGAISRALILGITSGKGGRQAAQEQQAQAAAKESVQSAKEQVQASKLQARDPEKMREVLKAGNEEGKKITLDGTVVQQFFQSGIDPEEFFNLAPSAREQFEQADAAGTDISIPLDEFLHAIATAPENAYDFMTDFVKIDPDVDPALQGWDLQNPDDLNAFIQQSIRQAQEEWGARFEAAQDLTLDERIERQIRDNLMNRELMGEKARAPEAAASEAALYGAFARTLSKRGGDAAMRVFERRFGTNFQVEGYRPPLPRRIGTGSAYYDKIRAKVKAKRNSQKAADKKRASKAGFFGITKPKRAKATPTPLINALIKRGGIDRESPIAAELKHIGITPKSHPRLYARGKLRDIDNIPADDIESDLGTSGVFSRDEEFNGYASRQELLDRLRDETFGDYIRSDEELQLESFEEAEQQLIDALNEEGVDIETATAEEIDAAIDRANKRYREEYESEQPGMYYQSAPIKTDTPEFKKWFGDSKVVDADGKPLVVYHGTDAEFESFIPSSNGVYGPGAYFTKYNGDAATYGKNVIPVYLSIQNPLKMSMGDFRRLRSEGVDVAQWAEEQQAQGFDGIVTDDMSVIVAFRPEQIKSVHNRGTFDANDPRILYQENRGVTQFNDRGQTIVKLFAGADESTLLHETGHVFLDIFAEIASQPDAPQDIKDMWNGTLQWMGVSSAADIKTNQHEQFARGFEAYLYKGEAPSAELRGTFDRFKLWLANLYRSIRQLNVNVSPEMKDIFDRLLATNDEIDALRSNPLVTADQATLEMLSPAQREDYLKRKADALRNAKDKLFRKAIRQARRKNTEWWKEESARVQAEVEAELQAQPVYKAIQFLQTGTDFSGDPVSDQMPEHRLNEAAIVKVFDDASPINPLGKQELKYLPRGIRTTEGGTDPRLVADMFGFRNALEMLNAMKGLDPYKAAVQKMTEDRMIAKHGDMLNDGTIEAEALAMVMAEDTKAAQVELKALSERTGAAYPSDGDFAKAAEIALGTLTVDQAIKPDKYYRAALRATREYGKAMQAKQYEDRTVKGKDGKQTVVKGAASWKRQEILNKHLYRLSKAAQEETTRALDKFKKLDKQPAKGNARAVKIDPAYHQKIWDILDKYNLNPRLSDAKRLRLELKALNDWIKAQEEDEGAALMMPPELLAADGKTHYRDLTLNEFRGLRDLVVNLETQGRNKRKYIMEGQQRDLEAVTAEMVATADQHTNPITHKLTDDQGFKATMGKIVGGIDAVNTKIQQVMVKMDGGDNFGIWTRTVFEPIQRAVIAQNIRLREEGLKVRALLDRYYGDERKTMKQAVANRNGKEITREHLISIALHYTSTQDNRDKLMDFYEENEGWDDDFVRDLLSKMRAKDWNFVMEVRDLFDSYWPETSAIEARRFGYAPEKLEGLPDEVFTTADGQEVTVRGGYMRIMYDSRRSFRTQANDLKDAFKEMTIGKGARPATKRGSQIERVESSGQAIRLDLDVIGDHVAEQVGIITMSETVENVAKVIRKAEVQDILHRNLGAEYKMMLDLWLQDVAVGGGTAAMVNGGWMRTLRTNYTVGKLGLKPLTAILQLSGLVQTASDPDLGIKYTLHGLAKFASKLPTDTAAEIQAKSVYMQERRFTLSRDTADALNEYTRKGKYLRDKTAALMLYPMQKMQAITDMVTWMGAYQKALDDKLDDADAVRYADLAVSRLQGSGLISDQAAIERGTVHTKVQRQELVKAGTVLFSYFNAKYNIIKNAKYKYDNKEITGVDLAATITLSVLVEGLVSAFLMGQLDWDGDDDDEVSLGEGAIGLGSLAFYQAAGTIPFGRTIASSMQGFTPQDAMSAQLAAIGKFVGVSMNDAYELATDQTTLQDINWYSRARTATDAVGVFLPVPSAQTKSILRGMEREAESGDAGLMDYLVYQKK